jgi:hypothetical protein
VAKLSREGLRKVVTAFDSGPYDGLVTAFDSGAYDGLVTAFDYGLVTAFDSGPYDGLVTAFDSLDITTHTNVIRLPYFHHLSDNFSEAWNSQPGFQTDEA